MVAKAKKDKLWQDYQDGKLIHIEDGCTYPIKVQIVKSNRRSTQLDVSLGAANQELALKNDELAQLREENRNLRVENENLQAVREASDKVLARYQEQLTEALASDKVVEVTSDAAPDVASDSA